MQPVVLTWLRENTTAIALVQTLGIGPILLQLNGTMIGNTPGIKGVSFSGLKQFRTISLTSVDDNSGTNFTVHGTLYGKPVSQTIAGPNNDTVFTTQLFESVTSINADAGVTALSAGIGKTGQFNWILFNYECSVPNLGVQVHATGSAGTITCNFASTLDDVATNSSPVEQPGFTIPDPAAGTQAFQTFLDAATDVAANTFLYATAVNQVFRYYTLVITDQSDDFNGNLIATFIQQGIR